MTGDEAARATDQCSLHEGPLLVACRHLFATTMIVTKLAIICATVANTGKMSVLGPCSFIGTNTSDPGSGLGSLWTSSARTRVRTRPLAYRTLTVPLSALGAKPPAELR